MSRVASRQAGATRAARTIVKRCQGVHRTRPATFRLGGDELLSKKRILRNQFCAKANEIHGQPENEPKKVDHVSSLTPSTCGCNL
jgi:hypothetical protein